MNILISPDSFKGTLSASEAADSIEKGIKRALPHCKTEKLPIADGGEGTMEALVSATNGHFVQRIVHDPLHRPHEATYGVLGNNHTCVIEMAQASGITLLHNSEKQPHIASSVGTGELIQHALNDGYRDFIICIGGSATNDGGVGMLRALGLQLNDESGEPVEASIFGLQSFASLDFSTWDSRIADSRFIVACDVDNPLIGEDGATAIFGPQKGVLQKDIPLFDGALQHWADIVEQTTGIHLHTRKGAGAAGGMGGALIAFCQAQFQQGIELVLQQVALEQKLAHVDLVITGEGKSDGQTLHGKAPYGVAQKAKAQQIPTLLVSAIIEDFEQLQGNFQYMTSIVNDTVTVDEALSKPAELLEQCVANFFTNTKL